MVMDVPAVGVVQINKIIWHNCEVVWKVSGWSRIGKLVLTHLNHFLASTKISR